MQASAPLQHDKHRLISSFWYPGFLVLLMWIIKFAEAGFSVSFHKYGIFPATAKGLIGIFTAPLIHGDFKHLFANSGPLLFLGAGVNYFYSQRALRIWAMAWLLTGVLVWLAGRASYHIGASGLVYCFASFLFFSGIIKRNTPLLAISLLVAFMYGSIFWGIFPIKEGVSWESHLMGFAVGIIAAFRYRNFGPVRKKYPWEDEDEADDDFHSDNTTSSHIHYHYKTRE